MLDKQNVQRKLTRGLLLLGLCVGLVFAGCSDEDTENILPNVALSINSLDFGQVDLDAFGLETVTVKNLTNENVIIERVTSTNDAFQIGGYFASNRLIVLETPFTIEANGARTLYIMFQPDAVGEYEGKVVIESRNENSSKKQTDLVELQGVGYLSEEEDED